MLGLAAAARPAVLFQSGIPVAPEDERRIPPTPVTGQAQPGDRRGCLPAGAKQASLSSLPRFSAAGPASAFCSEAIGAFSEARVMVWVRRFGQGYASKRQNYASSNKTLSSCSCSALLILSQHNVERPALKAQPSGIFAQYNYLPYLSNYGSAFLSDAFAGRNDITGAAGIVSYLDSLTVDLSMMDKALITTLSTATALDSSSMRFDWQAFETR
jgi:hypothetical protein